MFATAKHIIEFFLLLGVAIFITLAAVAWAVPSHAESKECAKIRAFNDKAPSMAATKSAPCHCIPKSERADKVYAMSGRVEKGLEAPPAGFECGNGAFYDKQCHLGLMCGPSPSPSH
jgi:hypothetical protein